MTLREPIRAKLSERPLPVRDVWPIRAKLPGVVFTRDLLVEQRLARARSADLVTRHAVDRIDGQAEAVGLIANSELQRRVDVALFFVAAHVDMALMRAVIGQPVDQPRIGMKVENDRPIRSKERLELAVCQTVRVLCIRDQLEQIYYVHEPDFDVRQVLAE